MPELEPFVWLFQLFCILFRIMTLVGFSEFANLPHGFFVQNGCIGKAYTTNDYIGAFNSHFVQVKRHGLALSNKRYYASTV
jgi:hypothetical protein